MSVNEISDASCSLWIDVKRSPNSKEYEYLNVFSLYRPFSRLYEFFRGLSLMKLFVAFQSESVNENFLTMWRSAVNPHLFAINSLPFCDWGVDLNFSCKKHPRSFVELWCKLFPIIYSVASWIISIFRMILIPAKVSYPSSACIFSASRTEMSWLTDVRDHGIFRWFWGVWAINCSLNGVFTILASLVELFVIRVEHADQKETVVSLCCYVSRTEMGTKLVLILGKS